MHHNPALCVPIGVDGRMGGMIGVVDVEVVEPRGEKIGGEREAG